MQKVKKTNENNRPQWPSLSSCEDDLLREHLARLHESALSKDQSDGLTQEEVLIRWPRLTAHLICQSLGYFSPRAAAHAILSFLEDKPCWCEWYFAQAEGRVSRVGKADILAVGRGTLRAAIAGRHRHRGMMAEYALGLAAVASELCGHGPRLASWF